MYPAENQSAELVQRKQAVLQAVANLAARGIAVSPDVLHLYGRYFLGHISRAEVQAVMQERAVAQGGQRRYPFDIEDLPPHLRRS